MKWKKNRFKTLTFTVLSNDVNKDVTRFRIPKISIPITTFLAIVPIILLVYFITISNQQKADYADLSTNFEQQTDKANGLEEKVVYMEKRTSEVQAKMEELQELESLTREQIEELPVDLEPKGGIDIPVSEKEKGHAHEGADSLSIQSSELIKRYKKTLADMEQTSKELKFVPTVWPAKSEYITSEFGVRDDPFNRSSSLHTGIDIRGKWGEPVYASANGTVTLAEYYGGYGNAIKIRHSDTYETLYGHLSEIKVDKGDTVEKGDVIGSIGSTGRSTGPHLHFEISDDGELIDPDSYIHDFDVHY